MKFESELKKSKYTIVPRTNFAFSHAQVDISWFPYKKLKICKI